MITIITTIINIIAAVLIAARVIYFQRYIKQTVGSDRNNQYTTVIIICIESSALIVLFSILFIVLFLTNSPASFIFIQSLVHINVRVHNLLLSCKNRESYVCLKYWVISPLLIVYRVALGKAVTCSPRRPEDGRSISGMHFAPARNTSSVNSITEYEQRFS